MSEDPGAVLITGCSSGIGHETARHLAGKGWTVYATARRPESIADLAEAGCETLALDVTDEASMRAAVDAVEAEHGAVGALVNNAGYSQSGALETLPMERLRAQFETNVFGLVRMCQLVLPKMRGRRPRADRQRQLDGRQARLPRRRRLPRDQVRGRGALRRAALRGQGLRDPRLDHRAGADHDQLRRDRGRIARSTPRPRARTATTIPTPSFNAAVGAATVGVYEGPMKRLGGGPETVAQAIERAISARNPKPRYKVTASARLALAQRRCSPTAPGTR